MQIRIFPTLIFLSVLAVIATACAAPSGSWPGPALAPQLTQVAAAADTPTAPSAGTTCPELACRKGKAAGGRESVAQTAFPSPTAEARISLPAQPQTDSEGAVAVEVTPAQAAPGTLVFRVSMNTHSVELNYDMTKIAALRDDQGRLYPIQGWEGGAGGHHRQGTLTFETPAGPRPKSVELTLSGISGVPSRVFKWDVQQGGQG